MLSQKYRSPFLHRSYRCLVSPSHAIEGSCLSHIRLLGALPPALCASPGIFLAKRMRGPGRLARVFLGRLAG